MLLCYGLLCALLKLLGCTKIESFSLLPPSEVVNQSNSYNTSQYLQTFTYHKTFADTGQ